jgi:hypothetical protein
MKKYYSKPHFEYKGFGIHDSFCEVEIWEHDNKFLVILTEPCTESSGTSVTNACEDIATKLYNQPGVFPKETQIHDIIWIEHYPERGFPETYDLIEFNMTNIDETKFAMPNWKHIGETLTKEKRLELLK